MLRKKTKQGGRSCEQYESTCTKICQGDPIAKQLCECDIVTEQQRNLGPFFVKIPFYFVMTLK